MADIKIAPLSTPAQVPAMSQVDAAQAEMERRRRRRRR